MTLARIRSISRIKPDKEREEIKVIDISELRRRRARRKGMGRNGKVSLLPVIIVLALFIGSIASPGVTAVSLNVEVGSTTEFGGGGMVKFQLGESSLLIIYGTAEKQNGITVVYEYPRYLGVVEAYDSEGALVERAALEVETIVVHRMHFLAEFEEMPDENVFQTSSIKDTPARSKIKALELVQSWRCSEVIPTDSGYEFSLYLENIDYSKVWSGGDAGDGAVQLVKITFHIEVHRSSTTIVGVPWYRVSLSGKGGSRSVASVEQSRTESYSGTLISWSSKYDIEVEGWDFKGSGSKLLFGTTTFFGSRLIEAEDSWIDFHLVREIKGEGTAAEIDSEIDDEPKILDANLVDFSDNWMIPASLSWNSSATVDGKEVSVQFQVHNFGGDSFNAVEGPNYRGVWLKEVLGYPAGLSVRHDPLIGARVLIFNPFLALDLLPWSTVGVHLLIVAVGSVAAYITAFKRRTTMEELKKEEKSNIKGGEESDREREAG